MWAYASKLPNNEYREWIEDGSTMTDVKIGMGPPILDKIIKSPVPWIVISFWAVYLAVTLPMVYWDRQIAVAVLSVLACILIDHYEDRLPLTPTWHFILFGAGRKFNKTDWNPTPVVPLLTCIGMALFGNWMGMCTVTLLQVARANRLIKLA